VVRPLVGAGGGLIVPWSNEVASNRVRKERGLVAYAGGTFQLLFALNRSLFIRASFKAGAAIPRVDIFFNDASAAHFGLPLVEGQVLLEFRIP
jgi:hypothetical protein